MLSTSGTSKPRIKEKLKFESAILTEKVTSEMTMNGFSRKSSATLDIITGLELRTMQ